MQNENSGKRTGAACFGKINDPVLHLAVHLAFMCNMRPGEVVGTDAEGIDLANKYFKSVKRFSVLKQKPLKSLLKMILSVFSRKETGRKDCDDPKKPKTEKVSAKDS